MKTIQFIGEEKHVEAISNFHKNTWNKTDTLQQSETRVYVVDTHKVLNKSHSNLTDDEFMTLAETDGNILTLPIFQKHYNIGEFDEPHYVIRFINVPKFD